MTRSEDLQAADPAGAQLQFLEESARRGQLHRGPLRVLVDRGSNEEFGVESIAADALRRPVPLAGPGADRARVAADRCSFVRMPRPTTTPAAFAVESLIDSSPGGWASTRWSFACATWPSRATALPQVERLPVFGARQCLERVRDHPLGRSESRLPEGEKEVSAWPWAGGLAPATSRTPACPTGRRRVPDGHNGSRADLTRVQTVFAAIAADAFGVNPAYVEVVAADTSSAPYAGTSGGSKVTYTVGRAVGRAALDARQRLLGPPPRSWRSRPRTWTSSTGRCSLAACRSGKDRSSWAPRSSASAAATPPVEGHGRVALPPGAPVRGPPVARAHRP